MAKPPSIKKTIQKKLAELTIRVFEELSKTKATDKIKKSLSKSSRKASNTVYNLLKKGIKAKAKKVKKEKKALVRQNKKMTTKKPKEGVAV